MKFKFQMCLATKKQRKKTHKIEISREEKSNTELFIRNIFMPKKKISVKKMYISILSHFFIPYTPTN